jgi:hypothetical protein
VGHADALQYCRATSVLEDTRMGAFQRGYMESHPSFTYVLHLEKKKSSSFRGLQVKCA